MSPRCATPRKSGPVSRTALLGRTNPYFAEKGRQRSRQRSAALRATAEGREAENARVREYWRRMVSTPDGRERYNAKARMAYHRRMAAKRAAAANSDPGAVT